MSGKRAKRIRRNIIAYIAFDRESLTFRKAYRQAKQRWRREHLMSRMVDIDGSESI